MRPWLNPNTFKISCCLVWQSLWQNPISCTYKFIESKTPVTHCKLWTFLSNLRKKKAKRIWKQKIVILRLMVAEKIKLPLILMLRKRHFSIITPIDFYFIVFAVSAATATVIRSRCCFVCYVYMKGNQVKSIRSRFCVILQSFLEKWKIKINIIIQYMGIPEKYERKTKILAKYK